MYSPRQACTSSERSLSRVCLQTSVNFGPGGGTQIDIVHGNVLDTDIDDATAVFVYLVPAGIKLLKQALVSRLHRGARVVTYGACCFESSGGCLVGTYWL